MKRDLATGRFQSTGDFWSHVDRSGDLVGKTFGRLTVVRLSNSIPSRCSVWECTCSCGRTKLVRSAYLLNGDTRSCGCLCREVARARMKSDRNPARQRIIDAALLVPVPEGGPT